MNKTKFGISIALYASITYIAALVGGFVPAILLAGYALIFEDNRWLKGTVLKALFTLGCFYSVIYGLDLLTDITSLITSILLKFDVYQDFVSFDNNIAIIVNIIGVIKDATFILLSILALHGNTIKIPFVDGMLRKYI